MKRRVLICNSQVPFAHGGAELLVESLATELVGRGFDCEVVRLPFAWSSRRAVLESAVAWRLLDLSRAGGQKVDLVIATRFPSYLVRHPNKVVWLVHQFRQVYDLAGTAWSDFTTSAEDRKLQAMVRAMDRRTLAEARGLYSISRNTARRLRRFNGLEAEVLYPPSKLAPLCRTGEPGDYVFTAGRLDAMKRFDLLVRAMRHTKPPLRCRIAGTGPEADRLRELIRRHGLEERVELLGWVGEEELAELYAGCLAVFYAPYDEDFGYVTVEAFQSGKPVVTTSDAGGVLEFVDDGVNGHVCPPDSPRELAGRLDRLFAHRDEARRLGEAGRRRVAAINWDRVVARLTESLA